MKIKTADMVKSAAGAAALCVVAPLCLPTLSDSVPMTLGTFAVMFVAATFGKFRGTVSVLLYIALGAIGLPVFSGFIGGISRIAGPSGGFIMGYLPCAFTVGLIVDCASKKFIVYPVAMLAGLLFVYAGGVLWYMFFMKTGLEAALVTCVVPFIVFDIAKAALASFLAFKFRKITDTL